MADMDEHDRSVAVKALRDAAAALTFSGLHGWRTSAKWLLARADALAPLPYRTVERSRRHAEANQPNPPRSTP